MNKFVLVTIALSFCSQIIFAGDMTPFQLLEKYKTNHKLLKSHITQSEEFAEVIDSANGNKPEWTRTLTEFRTDGNRVDSITKRWFNLSSPNDKCSDDSAITANAIWDGERWIAFYPHAKQAIISQKETHKHEFISYGYSGASLDGFFWGDKKPIEDVLNQATDIVLRPQKDTVSGVDCYIIDADTAYGKYSVWIDPEHGYNIVRAKVIKGDTDIIYGRSINQTDICDFSFSIDNVDLQKIDGGWLPISAEYQISTKYTDGRVITEKKIHTRTEIDPNPDFEAIGAFIPNIPDETYVVMDGVEGIGYKWFQGKPVTDIDQDFLDELEGATKQIKQEVKSDFAETLNKDAEEILDKCGFDATETRIAAPNGENVELKNAPERSLLLAYAFILASVIIIGIVGWLLFRSFRRGHQC